MLRPSSRPGVLVLVACLGLLVGCGRTIEDPRDGGDGGGGAAAAAPATWEIPDCPALAMVDGVPVFDVPFEAWGVAALDDPNVVLVAARALQRSADGGCTWEPLHETDFGEDYGWVAVRRGGGAYVAGGGHALARVDGATITGLSVPPTGDDRTPEGFAFAVDPSDGDHLLAFRRGDGLLFRTEDGATTWSLVGPAPGFVGATIHPGDRDDVVVVTDDGVARTRDGGATWSPASCIVDGAPAECPAGRLVRSIVDGDVLHLVGGGPESPGDEEHPLEGVYRSVDGGTSFTWEGPPPRGRVLSSPEAPAAMWTATAQWGGDGWSSWGIELAHVVDGVERERVTIPGASEVLARSPAGALYVARAAGE